MSAEQVVLQFLRDAKEPISGQNVRILLADRIPAGSVSACLSTLVEKKLAFNKPIPGAKGKLYWHKPFTPGATMTGAPNRPQATAPAPSVLWPTALPSKRVLPAVAKLAEQNLDRVEQETQADKAESKPASSDFAGMFPGDHLIRGGEKAETEAAPHPSLFKRKGYEFSLLRGPVAFDLPHDLTGEEIVTLAVMLDAYGQLKRREVAPA